MYWFPRFTELRLTAIHDLFSEKDEEFKLDSHFELLGFLWLSSPVRHYCLPLRNGEAYSA